MSFWARTNILTTEKPHIVSKLKVLSISSTSELLGISIVRVPQQKLYTQFTMQLCMLFDIPMQTGRKRPKYSLTANSLLINVGPEDGNVY